MINIYDQINVLNLGHVRLVEVMGNDNSIVQSARVSYGKGITTPEKDERLIRYLMKNEHWTPFEQVELKWHIKLPIFVARQWIRTRTASVNEISGRYTELKNEYFVPLFWRKQNLENKQGSADVFTDEKLKGEYTDMCENIFKFYNKLLDVGVSKELARIILPVSTYTEWYWKIDLRNLFNFLKLRLDEHAQEEIRMYGLAMERIVKEVVPVAYKAFEDFILKPRNK